MCGISVSHGSRLTINIVDAIGLSEAFDYTNNIQFGFAILHAFIPQYNTYCDVREVYYMYVILMRLAECGEFNNKTNDERARSIDRRCPDGKSNVL